MNRAQPTGGHSPFPSAHLPSGEAFVEAVAQRTAELVVERLAAASVRPVGRVDAHVVAAALGMSVEWVRDHADELGAERRGDGPRPRLRFDLEVAVERAAARSVSKRPEATDPSVPSAKRRRRPSAEAELLPIRRPNGGQRAA